MGKTTKDFCWVKKRIKTDTNSGCWIWYGAKRNTGYGFIEINWRPRKRKLAHRHVYELFNGPIPRGLFVLHKCDIPLCVNPEHLFLGTQKDNMVDCSKKDRFNNWMKKRTHCKNGHEFSIENTHVTNKGRYCRLCRRKNIKKWRDKKKEPQMMELQIRPDQS